MYYPSYYNYVFTQDYLSGNARALPDRLSDFYINNNQNPTQVFYPWLLKLSENDISLIDILSSDNLSINTQNSLLYNNNSTATSVNTISLEFGVSTIVILTVLYDLFLQNTKNLSIISNYNLSDTSTIVFTESSELALLINLIDSFELNTQYDKTIFSQFILNETVNFLTNYNNQLSNFFTRNSTNTLSSSYTKNILSSITLSDFSGLLTNYISSVFGITISQDTINLILTEQSTIDILGLILNITSSDNISISSIVSSVLYNQFSLQENNNIIVNNSYVLNGIFNRHSSQNISLNCIPYIESSIDRINNTFLSIIENNNYVNNTTTSSESNLTNTYGIFYSLFFENNINLETLSTLEFFNAIRIIQLIENILLESSSTPNIVCDINYNKNLIINILYLSTIFNTINIQNILNMDIESFYNYPSFNSLLKNKNNFDIDFSLLKYETVLNNIEYEIEVRQFDYDVIINRKEDFFVDVT